VVDRWDFFRLGCSKRRVQKCFTNQQKRVEIHTQDVLSQECMKTTQCSTDASYPQARCAYVMIFNNVRAYKVIYMVRLGVRRTALSSSMQSHIKATYSKPSNCQLSIVSYAAAYVSLTLSGHQFSTTTIDPLRSLEGTRLHISRRIRSLGLLRRLHSPASRTDNQFPRIHPCRLGNSTKSSL
jgi:hypothetical protein